MPDLPPELEDAVSRLENMDEKELDALEKKMMSKYGAGAEVPQHSSSASLGAAKTSTAGGGGTFYGKVTPCSGCSGSGKVYEEHSISELWGSGAIPRVIESSCHVCGGNGVLVNGKKEADPETTRSTTGTWAKVSAPEDDSAAEEDDEALDDKFGPSPFL